MPDPDLSEPNRAKGKKGLTSWEARRWSSPRCFPYRSEHYIHLCASTHPGRSNGCVPACSECRTSVMLGLLTTSQEPPRRFYPASPQTSPFQDRSPFNSALPVHVVTFWGDTLIPPPMATPAPFCPVAGNTTVQHPTARRR